MKMRKVITFLLTAAALSLPVYASENTATGNDANPAPMPGTDFSAPDASSPAEAANGERAAEKPIIVNIYYTGVNGNARKFVEEMISTGVVRAIRAEEGNLRYDYFFSNDDAETVLLIDGWKNQHSLDMHHASPMMAQIAALREKYDLRMKVERYVTDERGISETDKSFIRDKAKKSN